MDTPFEPKIPGQDAPSGTVTFLFTDIEGSTKLLEQLREQYGTLLADHRLILRQAFARFNGHEVDTQGDAFFVAFPRATQAVAAAVEAQRALAEHAWPEGVCCACAHGPPHRRALERRRRLCRDGRPPGSAHRPRRSRRAGAAFRDDDCPGAGRAACRSEPVRLGPPPAQGYPPPGAHPPACDRGAVSRVSTLDFTRGAAAGVELA